MSVDEIQTIIRNLKRRKAPGLDRVQNEHFIYGGINLAKCITHLFNAIFTVGCIPSCWKKDLFVPIYKGNKKPHKTPDSYRPIALLPCALKIFENYLPEYKHSAINKISKFTTARLSAKTRMPDCLL